MNNQATRSSHPWLHLLLVAGISLGATGCDQATKRWARAALSDGPIDLFDGRLGLILTTNRGAFLSLGAGLPEHVRLAILTVFVSFALAAGFGWLIRHQRRPRVETVALALMLGGGLGNVLDRALRSGAVTDFMLIRLGPLRTGIFNMADVFVTAGAVVLFTFGMFRGQDRPPKGDVARGR